MTSVADRLKAEACHDCVPELEAERRPEDGALIVAVLHEASCPWLARVAGPGNSSMVVRGNAVLIHGTRDAGEPDAGEAA